MPHEIIMPALGMSQDTGTLLAWHKANGDQVNAGDLLFEVETDKTTMEVEAPAAGYLVDVSALAGEEVPVGQVIAMINETNESASGDLSIHEKTDDASAEGELPLGHQVIMPTLGMSQDSGVLVNWCKNLGDFCEAEDVLFEVETDKSVVEVTANEAGYFSARLAHAGDDVPTGELIAVITKEPTNEHIDRAYVAQSKTISSTKSNPSPEPEVTKPPVQEADKSNPVVSQSKSGRILASPKLRRLAHQAGLSLEKLAAKGHPQPFHAADFEALQLANKQTSSGTNGGISSNHLVAEVRGDTLAEFLSWLNEKHAAISETAVLAALAGNALKVDAVVQVDSITGRSNFRASQQLSDVSLTECEADIYINDLRGSFIQAAQIEPLHRPVISITSRNEDLSLMLSYTTDQMTASEAFKLLNDFAGRIDDPIRHLF